MIDMNKKYTSGGQPARIICTDRKWRIYPVIALVTDKDGEEYIATFTADGKYYATVSGQCDLKEVPSFDWSKVSVDSLVMDHLHNKYHFCSYDPNIHTCKVFVDGKSSGTANGATQTFKAETLIPIG